MDEQIAECLRGSIDSKLQQQAEKRLSQIQTIDGFAPSLLRVVISPRVEMAARQAGAVYLKNLIAQRWSAKVGSPPPFRIPEQDRATIRDVIIDAVVNSPDPLLVHLGVCVGEIVQKDCWSQILNKICSYMQSPDPVGWSGALNCLYHIVKVFEDKKKEDRGPIIQAMDIFLPTMYRLCVQLLPDPSEQSVLLQKLILKIYSSLTQISLPLYLITQDVFAQWMEIFRTIVDRPVPDQANAVAEEDRAKLPWWKCKKWALHILCHTFERYGCPSNTTKVYRQFAKWYIKTFSKGILMVLLKTLDQYSRKMYVSPRVLQESIYYMNRAVSEPFSWKVLEPHMVEVVKDVLFLIMSYSQSDETLWNNDPEQYIRFKLESYDDFESPVTAAQSLLTSVCQKRKAILHKTVQFIMGVLMSTTADPQQKDGALHMVGILAVVMLKKKLYKDQMDTFLGQHVFPEFTSPHGYLRARAFWLIQHFSDIKFEQELVLAEVIRLSVNALLTDQELPVKVEAAIALQVLLKDQKKAQAYIQPQITNITLELLPIIRDTVNSDLTSVMRKIVRTFPADLMPIAVEIFQHLTTSFSQVLQAQQDTHEKSLVATGLWSTIDTMLTVLEDQPDIIAQLQPTVPQLVAVVFAHDMEFYEEAMTLVEDMTSKTISADMWKVLELMYQAFEKNGSDYFTGMMSALHNYITVDTPAFVSNGNHVLAVFTMCKAVLIGDSGEEPERNAAKLLEVMILQCKGLVDQYIPWIVELVLLRLAREVKTPELRAMCVQVVVAAIYYNTQLALETLERIPATVGANVPITSHLVKLWFEGTESLAGLHDRKICVLGLCALVSFSPARPTAVHDYADKIVPSLIRLFEGLTEAYTIKAREAESEDDEEEESDSEQEDYSSDEDDSASESNVKKAHGEGDVAASTEDDDSDKDEDEESDNESEERDEEIELESYTTTVDEEDLVNEYIIFKEVLQNIQATDSAWYQALTGNLNVEQQTALQELIVLAEKKKAAADSKRIEQSGGFPFTLQSAPTTYNFGGTGF